MHSSVQQTDGGSTADDLQDQSDGIAICVKFSHIVVLQDIHPQDRTPTRVFTLSIGSLYRGGSDRRRRYAGTCTLVTRGAWGSLVFGLSLGPPTWRRWTRPVGWRSSANSKDSVINQQHQWLASTATSPAKTPSLGANFQFLFLLSEAVGASLVLWGF